MAGRRQIDSRPLGPSVFSTSGLEGSYLEKGTVFTLTWKIENIGLYKTEMKTVFSSPSFEIGTTNPFELHGTDTLQFQIYLSSGDWSTKHIGIRVLRPIEHVDDLDIDIKSEVTLLSADLEVIEIFGKKFSLWDILSPRGCRLYPNPMLFSDEKVLSRLSQNTLTIRWKVYSIQTGECSFHTVLHHKSFRWNIRDFTKRPTFTKLFHLPSLHLTIDLSKLQDKSSDNIVVIKFIPSHLDRLHFGSCTIAAVHKVNLFDETIWHYGKVQTCPNKYINFDNKAFMCGTHNPPLSWEAPILIDKFIVERNPLILQWELTVGVDKICKGNDLQSSHKRKLTVCQSEGCVDGPAFEEVSTISMQSDMLHLYEEKKLCDVTLKAAGSSFPAHRSVLGARSPVFCAMFERDTEEGRTSIVHVPDMKAASLDKMLRFLYTDILGAIPYEMAAELYGAAERYRIQVLKDKCLSLLKYPGDDCVAVAVALAFTFQDEYLMRAVKDYVSDNVRALRREEWKEFEHSSPQLATKFLREVCFEKDCCKICYCKYVKKCKH